MYILHIVCILYFIMLYIIFTMSVFTTKSLIQLFAVLRNKYKHCRLPVDFISYFPCGIVYMYNIMVCRVIEGELLIL
jgi:hypothetical protein